MSIGERPDDDARVGRRRLALLAGPSQDGADARQELAEPERLDHVVVGAELEQDHAVDLVAARGDHDDGHLGPLAEQAADVLAVHVGQAEVEEHEVALVRLESRRPGGGELDVESLAPQTRAERLGDARIVFYDEEAHCPMFTQVGAMPTRCADDQP